MYHTRITSKKLKLPLRVRNERQLSSILIDQQRLHSRILVIYLQYPFRRSSRSTPPILPSTNTDHVSPKQLLRIGLNCLPSISSYRKRQQCSQPAIQQRTSPRQLIPTPLATHFQAMPAIPPFHHAQKAAAWSFES